MAELQRVWSRKAAGVLVPLFSLRTAADRGIGDFHDLVVFAGWLASKGVSVLNLLPINEAPLDAGCPYTAVSAFAIDPIFLRLESVEDVVKSESARRQLASPAAERSCEFWQRASSIRWGALRRFKLDILRQGFARFLKAERRHRSERSRELDRFIEEQRGWLDDYVVFRHLKDTHRWSHWTSWEEPLRRRDAGALAELRRERAQELLFWAYVQWQCRLQWSDARRRAAAQGVRLLGDLPFLVQSDSADVWARQEEFNLDETVGAPPDYFNPEGQKWGLPAYRWDKVEASDYDWWRRRLRQAGELYDLVRIDHVVGFFRTYVFHSSGRAYFVPMEEDAQRSRGERFLKMVNEEGSRPGGAAPIAEDLGAIPPFVRQIMLALHMPGYKVLRWEKTGEAYADPGAFPHFSVALTGTHDTSTLSEWWDELPDHEKIQAAALALRSAPNGVPPFDDRLLAGLQERVLSGASVLAVLPLHDLFGWRGRINLPGTVSDRNWTWRMPMPIEKLDSDPALGERSRVFSELVRSSGRS